MTREKVLKQLNKTGGSPFSFETLTAQIEGDLFLPVQALNELRRTGFQELEKKLTGTRVLTGEGGIGAQFRPVPTKTAAPQSQSVLTAFLEETAQLSPVLARGEISVVYLDADGFNPDQWRDIGENSAGWPFRRYSVPMPRGTWERTATCCARQALTAC